MRLADVVAHSGLTFYAEAALVIFFGVFVAVLVRTFDPRRRRELDADARLPLDDDTPNQEIPR